MRPEEYVGRVMGTAQVHRSAGEIVPLALAPGLAAAFGVQPVMIAGAVLARRRRAGDAAVRRRRSTARGAETRARCASTRRCRPTIRSARSR